MSARQHLRARSIVYPSHPLIGANPRGKQPNGEYFRTDVGRTFARSRANLAELPARQELAGISMLAQRQTLIDAHPGDEATAAMVAEPEPRWTFAERALFAVAVVVGAALVALLVAEHFGKVAAPDQPAPPIAATSKE